MNSNGTTPSAGAMPRADDAFLLLLTFLARPSVRGSQPPPWASVNMSAVLQEMGPLAPTAPSAPTYQV